MAAYIAAYDDNFYAQIYSGQGKSIVILLLAIYYIKHHKVKSVLIVTCTELLRNSLQHDLRGMCPTGYYESLRFSFSTSTVNYGKSELVLVDEADETLKNIF